MSGHLREDSRVTRWTFADLQQNQQAFDALVGVTPDIDRVCSASAWCLAAARHLHQGTEARITAVDDGVLAFMQQDLLAWGRMWMPLEASWCLASPLVGPDPLRLVDVLVAQMAEDPKWDSIFVAGLVPQGALWHRLLRACGQRYHLYRGPKVTRCLASLADGPAHFLARRSAKFRKNLRRTLRRNAATPFHVEYWSLAQPESDWDLLYTRLLAVEALGWKGKLEQGMDQEPMVSFYRQLVRNLGAQGRLRLLFLQHQGRDVGYILGGVQFNTYRGFQFSFDDKYRAHSLGNLMQWYQIGFLCEEGVGLYDLGTDMDYKRRWSEQRFTTETMVLRRNPL